MKNNILKIILLCAVLFLVATSAHAQNPYPIQIGGTAVTSDNCDNITGDWLNRGMVTYDPVTFTLTLDDAEIALNKTSGSPDAIVEINAGGTCNIILKGSSKIMTDSLTCIKSIGNVTLAGDGDIIMTAPQGIAVSCDMQFTVYGCHFGIAQSKVGFLGMKESGVDGLNTYSSVVRAYRSTMIMFCDSLVTQEMGGFSLVNEEYLYPEGKITFSPSLHSLVLNGRALSGALMLGPLDLQGDLNADDVMNVTDVTLLINLILNGGNEDYITAHIADLNGDSNVNVTDVTVLINEILGL